MGLCLQDLWRGFNVLFHTVLDILGKDFRGALEGFVLVVFFRRILLGEICCP